MSNATLITHRGAQLVTAEELARIQIPPPTETWFPLAHSDVLNRTIATLEGTGFQPKRTQLAVSRGGAKFFGTIDLESPIAEGVSLAVGVRNSIDRTLPIAFAAGERVLICDNLAFRSEIVVARKHTRFGADRFAEAIAKAVAGLAKFQEVERKRIEHFRTIEVADRTAESLILRAFEREIISHYLLPKVLADWRQPPHEAFAARTLWSLENAFTGVLAGTARSNPQRFCGLTIALQKLLATEVSGVEPQFTTPA